MVANNIYGTPWGPNEGGFSFRILIFKTSQTVLRYYDSLKEINYSGKKFKCKLKSHKTNKCGPSRNFKIIILQAFNLVFHQPPWNPHAAILEWLKINLRSVEGVACLFLVTSWRSALLPVRRRLPWYVWPLPGRPCRRSAAGQESESAPCDTSSCPAECFWYPLMTGLSFCPAGQGRSLWG